MIEEQNITESKKATEDTHSSLSACYLPSVCDCEKCQNACKNRPGWFLPEEINSLFAHFKANNISQLLGKDKFAIDWWIDDEENILVLAPNIVGNDSIQYPANPRGQCVFFKGGKCNIHEIKPFECSRYIHTEKDISKRHEEVAKEWRQNNILEAFRDDIEYHSWSIFDEMGFGGLW